jgi:hypothetical protein
VAISGAPTGAARTFTPPKGRKDDDKNSATTERHDKTLPPRGKAQFVRLAAQMHNETEHGNFEIYTNDPLDTSTKRPDVTSPGPRLIGSSTSRATTTTFRKKVGK